MFFLCFQCQCIDSCFTAYVPNMSCYDNELRRFGQCSKEVNAQKGATAFNIMTLQYGLYCDTKYE
jgi:hypothetical protein